jgi:glycosyltransferase involved in cell wall biosynthesis
MSEFAQARILLISDSYPPLIGGATRDTWLLAHQLLERGHSVAVATAWQAGAPATEDDAGVEVFRVRDVMSRVRFLSADRTRHTPPPFPDPEAVWRLRRIIRRVRPAIVISYGWLSYSTAAALAGTRLPMILSLRDYGNVCALRTLFWKNREICSGPRFSKCLDCAATVYGPIKGTIAVGGVLAGRSLLRTRMRAVQSCSGYVQSIADRFLVRSTGVRHVVLPSFRAPGDEGAPDDSVLSRLPVQPYILFVGAFRRVKGVEQLLEAYARLETPPPLVLIGTRAPDSPEVFPPGVTVLENVPHATVLAAWDRALFGVAPSTLPEPFGNVIHEAMSRGRPVIGTRPGGHGEMILPGRTGFLVPAGDVAALVDAMRQLIADPGLREGMGEAARVNADRFTAERMMQGWERLIRDVLDEPRPDAQRRRVTGSGTAQNWPEAQLGESPSRDQPPAKVSR